MAEFKINRTPHEVAKERIVAKVWQYVRNHQHSLESERCCRLIGELADVFDQPRQDELQEARDLADKLRQDLAKKTEQYNEMKREVKRLMHKYEALDDVPEPPPHVKKKGGRPRKEAV